MKNLFITTIITASLATVTASAEVHEREYYYDGGTRVYFDDLESASGATRVRITPTQAVPIYRVKEHVPLEDTGGNYDSGNDVYRPDLEFAR